MRDDFNKEAMEEKIKVNQEKGLSLSEIKFHLMQEKMGLLKEIEIKEARIVELTDQIDYMKENYGGSN